MSKSLDAIIGGFNPDEARSRGRAKDEEMIGVWLPSEFKARYDALQKNSGKSFSKTLRELVRSAIEMAEAKTA